jgi:SAM-dependent methyltransferase
MVTVDPDQFYTGIVADLYRPLRSAAPDAAAYARFIERFGQPALELGCGDGDPLLDLVRLGFDVEGLDSSADMLERCQHRAADLGLDVTLHRQQMQRMDLGKRYRSIYLAGATFNLLPDDETARRVLTLIRAHLTLDGAALIPLTVPAPVPRLESVREAVDARGDLLRVVVGVPIRDDAHRDQRTPLVYERIKRSGPMVRSVREWVLHWYPRSTFQALAEECGLATLAVVELASSPEGDETFAFVLGRSDREPA